MKDLFGYRGKRVVMTGAASGMGQAAARLLVEMGAEVFGLDIKQVTAPVKKYIQTNLMEKKSIDAAVEQIPGEIHVLLNCAGIAGEPFTEIQVCLVNFIGHRHLIDTLLPRMGEGSAIVTIASLAGGGWPFNLPMVKEVLATRGFDEGRAWLEENNAQIEALQGKGYVLSKQCNIVHAKMLAWELAKRKIRINTLSPGVTETPLLPDFFRVHGKEMLDSLVSPIARYATPEEMAEPLIFLNSDMARYISGQDLQVDYGTSATHAISQG